MGYDSDHPRAEGEVGKTGVAIDSIEDMRRLFAEIPLDTVSTSMTINATAPILLAAVRAGRRGTGRARRTALAGTVQNDLLKEYAARGTYIYPPKPSMRLITDLFAYCNERIPKWNTISISGYHMREAGATAAQEIAFTLADGIAYVQAALDAGLAVDDFAPRLSFFFACHQHFFEEVAKFRAARRLWARIMRERFGATDERSTDAAVPHADRRRDAHRAAAREQHRAHALEALSAVLGGTQSLHTNAFDEALALPTEDVGQDRAADPAGDRARDRRVATVVDPLGGSYFVEALTDELETLAQGYIEKIDGMGGAVAAIEQGFYQDEIHEAAFRIQQAHRARRSGRRGCEPVPGRGGAAARAPADRRGRGRAPDRPGADASRRRETRRRSTARFGDVRETARGDGNLLPPMREALRARATLGEVSDVLRDVFGEYRPAY